MAKKKPASPILEEAHYGYWKTTTEGVQLAGGETASQAAAKPKDGGKSGPR